MSLYSEMMGSFIRTGNYPMEANYIFDSQEDLINFYNDPINRTTLHVGLFRIVKNETKDEQALYWAVPNEDGFLYFEKLIDYKTVNNLDELKDKLEQEIIDRKEGDDAIWGTRDTTEINSDLNSILKLSEAILEIRDTLEEEDGKIDTIKDELKATVGTEEDDIISYLLTLDYTSLTAISEALNKFLNTIDDEDTTINTLPELLKFLEGFEYTHNLYECFKDLWNLIEGDPTPNTQFRTLRGIQDFVEALASANKNRMDNIQTELDLTLVGVGLSGDGAYNADQETYYLKSATSVMNALKILDSLINLAINNCNIEPLDSESVSINIIKEATKTSIQAKVKVSPEVGNDILIKPDGLYHNIDTEYEDGVLTVKVNGNVRQLHVLGLSSIVENGYYDPDQEAIIIVFKLQDGTTLTVTIPTGALISEWEIDNSISSKVVELEKVRVTGSGADKLSADVRLSTNKYNILVKDNNSLLVEGTADNIVYDGDVTVKSKLDSLVSKDELIDSSITDLTTNLNNEITRAKEAERDIQLALDNEITRSTEKDLLLTDLLNAEIERAKTAEEKLSVSLNAEINRSIDADNLLEKSITDEINRATLAEHILQDNIDALNTKVDTEIAESRKVEAEIKKDLYDEILRASTKDEELKQAILNETTRATAAETELTQNLNNEILRSTNLDLIHTDNITKLTSDLSDLNTKVDNEVNRAILKENDLALTIQAETDRASKSEATIQSNLDNEVTRATNAETALDSKIDSLKEYVDTNYSKDSELSTKVDTILKELTDEIARAKSEETELNNKINLEKERATNAEVLLDHKIDDVNTALNTEVERAKATEELLTNNVTDLSSKLDAEITRSTTKDDELTTAISNEITRATETETTLSNELVTLISKCISPNATTALEAQNELAKLGSKYSTVEEIGKTLKAFLEDSDFADSTINKWQEIESFLSGITDQDTLEGLLQLISQSNKEDISKIQLSLNDEVNRAKLAEQELQNNINLETERATNAETLLDHKIDDTNTALNLEIERAKEAEASLQSGITETNSSVSDINSKLDAEITRSVNKDNEILTNLDLEVLRATSAESNLDTKIETVQTIIKETINVRIDTLLDNLNQEISRSVLKDSELDGRLNDINISLNNEITRAESAENILSSRLDSLEQSLDDSNNTGLDLSSKLQEEITRSIAKDQELQDSINREKDRAIAAEIAISDELHHHMADYDNPHRVTAELLNLYTKTDIDTKIKEVSDDLNELEDNFSIHIHDTNNPHNVTKEQIGLDKVDNTSDLEKPISVAVLNELNGIRILLSQKAENEDFLEHIYDYNNPHRVTKDQVGLGNVDNTSDKDKPISDATQAALDKKSDVGHKHTMADIADLENLPIVKGVIELLVDLPTDPENGEKWLLKTQPNEETNARFEILEYDAVNLRWNQKLLTNGGIACVIDGDVYKLNNNGLERILDVSDYQYFYNKIYDETKDLIEDIDWEENDATSDTNQQIRLKITYKTKYGDPNEAEATNPFTKKAVKYIDIDKSRFLANAYSRPATLADVTSGYATTVGEPLLILVMTTGDHVTISLKDSLNIYDPVDTNSIDMTVSDWTGNPSTSYKISGNVRLSTVRDATSLHIDTNGIYSTITTANTNSISINKATGTSKALTADLRIDNSLNNNSDVLLTVGTSGLSAKVIWGEYE